MALNSRKYFEGSSTTVHGLHLVILVRVISVSTKSQTCNRLFLSRRLPPTPRSYRLFRPLLLLLLRFFYFYIHFVSCAFELVSWSSGDCSNRFFYAASYFYFIFIKKKKKTLRVFAFQVALVGRPVEILLGYFTTPRPPKF